MYLATTAYQKIQQLTKRIRGVAGGTSASKTISILLWLIDACQNYYGQLTCSVVSETMPHLKRGAIRDFLNIMQDHGYYSESRWNKTDYICDFSDKSGRKILEFFSADQPGKVRGPRRDILFINEANNIPYETYLQLEVRTKKIVWLDWNPVAEFWWYTEVSPNQDVDFLTLTYLDNEGLDVMAREALEVHRNKPGWWRIYGEGLLGEAQERIYTGWEQIDEIPHEARLSKYGLDFGYTNAPTAIVAVYDYNGGYILDEICYQLRMDNQQIATMLLALPPALVVADAAEPKSISEIAKAGVNRIVPSLKGKDSVNHGIQFVQSKQISVTKTSQNLLKEYRNYLWMKDRDGKIINEPCDVFNHGLDAVRYAIASSQRWKPWQPNDPGGVKPYWEGLPG